MEQFVFEQFSPFMAHKWMAIGETLLRILLIGIVTYIAIRALRFGLQKLENVLLTIREGEEKTLVANEKRI